MILPRILPAATPEPIQRRFEAAIRHATEDPEFRAAAERDGLIVRHMNRAAMRDFARAVAEPVALRRPIGRRSE